MRPVRVGLTITATGLVIALGWIGWQAWHVSRSLSAAASDATTLQAAIDEGDERAVGTALDDLQRHAAAADDRTRGRTWALLAHLPLLGDDARGVRVVSEVLSALTDDGFQQIADSAINLDALLPADGRVPLDDLRELQSPVAKAADAFAAANRRLSSEDSSGYAGSLRVKYDALAERVSDSNRILNTAVIALDVVPGMLGADEPRNYLLVFQNNAEIRATGGLPGAWALVHAEDGQIQIVRQGVADRFADRDGQQPILPVTPEEEQVYGPQLGTYFQDANFTPDFPRTAELWTAWWAAEFSDVALDGVLSIDPVAISYLLGSAGPIDVDGVTLSADNVVEELLHAPYLEKDFASQDRFFAAAAREIFLGITQDVQSPVGLIEGIGRAAEEGRLLVAPSRPTERAALAGTAVEGAVPQGRSRRPHAEVTINDATGSKMSYFLRYSAGMRSQDCSSGVQTLLGTATVSQTISAAEAASLPEAVTGGGDFGIPVGRQLLIVRIYSPFEGKLQEVTLDGAKVAVTPTLLDGREVASIAVEISGPDDVVLSWSATTGEGQTDDGDLEVTPSVVPGTKSSVFASSCT